MSNINAFQFHWIINAISCRKRLTLRPQIKQAHVRRQIYGLMSFVWCRRDTDLRPLWDSSYSTRKVDTFSAALLNTVIFKLYRSYNRQIFSHLTWGNWRHRNSKYCNLGLRFMDCQNDIFSKNSDEDILTLFQTFLLIRC
jgi:hypothetical protein